MNQDVRIDREGLQNIRTGERQTMILADELEVSWFCTPTHSSWLRFQAYSGLNKFKTMQISFEMRIILLKAPFSG